MGDLSPAKCINPMGVRSLGVGSRVPSDCARGCAKRWRAFAQAGWRASSASWARDDRRGV
eukprot:9206447-Alexandrium_andersonii.AAC.1